MVYGSFLEICIKFSLFFHLKVLYTVFVVVNLIKKYKLKSYWVFTNYYKKLLDYMLIQAHFFNFPSYNFKKIKKLLKITCFTKSLHVNLPFFNLIYDKLASW